MRLALALLVTTLGCATAGPRFGQEVASSFAHDSMRKLTTDQAEIYYPAQGRESALKIASRLTLCLERLRAHAVTQRNRGKLLLYLTSANFNNAYVDGQYGGEPLHAVLPLYATNEGFHFDNLPELSVGDIGCHELLHYVQFEQIDGFWRWVNLIVGDIFGPQNYLERWFTEGLAQYYEGRLEHRTGRPNSPLYRAALESGLDSRGGRVGPGDLTLFQRELYPDSGAYLTGLHFIEFLADKYGEEHLWSLIDLQGRSIVSPLGVALRFKVVYGLSLGALVDQWEAELKAKSKPRPRPPGQTVLRDDAGYAVRLAAAPDGTLAAISSGRDEITLLRLLEPDGRVRVERPLTRLTPDRDYVSIGPGQVSGLSFTRDSRWLYLMNDDLSERGDDLAQLWKLDARTGELVEIVQAVGGSGGSVTPDGRAYVFVALSPGRAELTELDLATHARRVLATAAPGFTFAAPAVSPDGQRIAFSRGGPGGFDLVVREASGELRELTHDGRFNYGPRWIDAESLVILREHEGRAQAHLIDVDTGAAALLTRAPYAARDVAPGGGRLAFLNRAGWSWSIDATALESLEPVELEPAPAAPAEAAEGAAEQKPAVARSGELPLDVKSDAPYSGAEQLAVPLLRQPSLANLAVSCPTSGPCVVTHAYNLSLAGRDRLSFHNWDLEGYASFPDNTFSFAGGYVNTTLAPWFVSTGAAFDTYFEASPHQPPEGMLNRRTRQVSASINFSRSFWSTPFSIGVGGLERWSSDGDFSRFVGPSASFSWFAGDSTPYGGLKRALGFSGQVNAYPRGLGSRYDMLDVSAGVLGAVPLPGLKRQSLVLNLNARDVSGPGGALQVGGIPSGIDLATFGDTSGPPGYGGQLPRRFTLSVRGYEDYGVPANRAMVAGARWRYPFVIDRGTASILYLFPSLFFRQVELELFGSAALIDSRVHTWLRAVGGALYLRLAIAGSAPVSFYYRLAARFDEHLPPLHAIGLAFE